MKIFIYSLLAIAVALIVYNFTFLNFDNPFSEDSSTALIGILASSCVVVLMLILLVSRKISKKVEG